MYLIVLVVVAMMAWPFTIQVTSFRQDNGCRDVTVTAFFGLVRHVDTEVCGDEQVSFMGKTVRSTDNQPPSVP